MVEEEGNYLGFHAATKPKPPERIRDGSFAKGAARRGQCLRRGALIQTGEEEARLMRPVQLFLWYFMSYTYLPQDFTVAALRAVFGAVPR